MSNKPKLLLIAEKEPQLEKYKRVYFANTGEIPYQIYFAYLAGHVDEIKEGEKKSWNFENALNIPQEFLNWDFSPNAVNAASKSPYIKSKNLIKNIISVF